MKKFIYILLLVSIHFGFAQKKYTFNLYTKYENTDSNGNKTFYLVFGDTIKNKHELLIMTKNDTIKSVFFKDLGVHHFYTFDFKNKKIETLDFSKDFNSLIKEEFQSEESNNSQICDRFKYFDRSTKKLNDSIEVETFNFYKKKNKKVLKYSVTIEILINKKINNIVPSDFTGIINKCIDSNYNLKVINKINSTHFKEDGSSFKEKLQLIEINTTNFSINIQE